MRLLFLCLAAILLGDATAKDSGQEKPLTHFQLKGRSAPLQGEAPSATYCPTPTGNTPLTNGNSMCNSVPAGMEVFYTFNIPSGCNFLDLTVTDISGDPDLYVSRTITTPNQNNYQWADNGISGAEIQLTGQSPGPIYLGVYGFTDAIYLIVASCNDNSMPAVILKNGVPQNGRVTPTGTWLYYHFSGYNVGDIQLRVDLGAKNGDPDLYITADGSLPSQQNYNYRSIGYGSDYLEINAPLAAQYTIGVFGYVASDFTLYVSSNTASTLLMDRVSYESYLVAGEFEYFQFPIIVTEATPHPVEIVCTAISGDPDIYVSRYTSQPNQDNYEYASTRYGSDYITFTPTSTTYFMSVFGYQTTGYAVVYTTDGYDVLTEGEMMFDELPANAIGRYYFNVGSDKTQLRFGVEAQDGAARLYISNTMGPVPGNPSSYQWSTGNFSAVSEIVIMPSDPQYCENCLYYIAVQAWPNGTTDYNIVASTSDGAVMLARGEPWIGVFQSGASDYQYVMYNIEEQATALNLAMTAVSPQGYSETPNMFVSTSGLPNASFFTWRSVPNRPFITIYGPPSTTYYIGIQGRSLPQVSTFTALAYDDQTAVVDAIDLLNGYPQNWIESTSNVWRYFSYTTDIAESALLFYLQQMGCGSNDACSYHGTCVDGFCSCTPPWWGAYCDNQTSSVPQIYVALNSVPSFTNYNAKGGPVVGNYSCKITNAAPGTYYIGAYSSIPNWYSVMAMYMYFAEADTPIEMPMKSNPETVLQGMASREIKIEKSPRIRQGMANREKEPSPRRDSVHLHERVLIAKPF